MSFLLLEADKNQLRGLMLCLLFQTKSHAYTHLYTSRTPQLQFLSYAFCAQELKQAENQKWRPKKSLNNHPTEEVYMHVTTADLL